MRKRTRTTMTLDDLPALALTTAAVLLTWRHGSLFAGARAYWEARGGLLGELLGCPLCLSWHIAFWLCAAVTVLRGLPPHGPTLATIVLYAPAASAAGLWLYERLSGPYR